MIKNIIIAPDSFKGTMSSIEICEMASKKIKEHIPDAGIVCMPIADGGEGTVDAYHYMFGGDMVTVPVTGPEGDAVDASYCFINGGKTAVIEMAAASGLPLVKGPLCAPKATSAGTGELIMDAVHRGCRDIILGIGGSATTDGGTGAASALGVKFLDADGNEVYPCGENLGSIFSVDAEGMDPALRETVITVACDVKNPLCGENGAAHVFGPQKGASPEEVEMLDKGLVHLNSVFTAQFGCDRSDQPGMGAAGGFCLSLAPFLSINMRPGIDMILDAAGFDSALDSADLVITGEGRMDSQSLRGKVPAGVAVRAKKKGVPVIAVVGDVGDGCEALYDIGITSVISTNRRAVPWKEARLTSREDYVFAVDSLMRILTAVK